jgi:tetrahydromethanopterin S-methyltransferase subunit G
MAEMTAQEAAEWGKTLDFPTVWAALMESRAHLDRVEENLDKLEEKVATTTQNLDRLGEKIDRITSTTTRNLDKLGEKVDRVTSNVGGLNRSFGELIETLFTSHLGEKFDKYQYNLRRIFKRVPIYDDTSRLRGEIDILLSNTTVCMAVEVKRELDRMDQIDGHIRRMELIRQYPPAETNGKKLLGALAAAAVTPEGREYAELNGFFVLELSGEDVRLLEPPKDFQPREW